MRMCLLTVSACAALACAILFVDGVFNRRVCGAMREHSTARPQVYVKDLVFAIVGVVTVAHHKHEFRPEYGAISRDTTQWGFDFSKQKRFGRTRRDLLLPSVSTGRGPATRKELGSSSWEISCPLWIVALLLAAPPAVNVRRWRRAHRRHRSGLCRSCGYDLRATPTHCPECGQEATARTGGNG
jgi:hypothetical protein